MSNELCSNAVQMLFEQLFACLLPAKVVVCVCDFMNQSWTQTNQQQTEVHMKMLLNDGKCNSSLKMHRRDFWFPVVTTCTDASMISRKQEFITNWFDEFWIPFLKKIYASIIYPQGLTKPAQQLDLIRACFWINNTLITWKNHQIWYQGHSDTCMQCEVCTPNACKHKYVIT